MQSLEAKLWKQYDKLENKLDKAYDSRENRQRGTDAWMYANELVEHLRYKMNKLNQRIVRL